MESSCGCCSFFLVLGILLIIACCLLLLLPFMDIDLSFTSALLSNALV